MNYLDLLKREFSETLQVAYETYKTPHLAKSIYPEVNYIPLSARGLEGFVGSVGTLQSHEKIVGASDPCERDDRPAIQAESPPPGDHWRKVVAFWPIELRQKWADLAESSQAAGQSWRGAEWSAFLEVVAHINDLEATGETIGFRHPGDGAEMAPFPAFEDLPGPDDLGLARTANRSAARPEKRRTKRSRLVEPHRHS